MPLYGFHCARCEDNFETLARHDETPACPSCNSKKVSRTMSRIARPRTGGAGVAAATADSSNAYSSVSDAALAGPSKGHGGGCGCC